MDSYFADTFDRHLLLELAGGRFFERGEDYYRRGAVRSLVEHEGTLTARVIGNREYRVRFRAKENGGLSYSCSCPVGGDGLFCKHCVAVRLVRLEEGAGERGLGRGRGQGPGRAELGPVIEEE